MSTDTGVHHMLGETLLRTDVVPAHDRFDLWRDHLHRTYAPTDLTCDDTADFPATQRLLRFGAVQLWTIAHPPLTLRRTPALIRRSDPALCHVSLPRSGTMEVAARHGSFRHRPGDIVLQDTSRPTLMRATTDPGCRRVAGTGVFVPKELLPLPAGGVDGPLAGGSLTARCGPGALLATVLAQLIADTRSFGPADGPRLQQVVVDLITSLICHTLDADTGAARDARHRTLVLRVKDHARRRLGDPELSPRGIAAAHHISVGHLHRLFQGEETTLAAWIRTQRLERIRRDLADPALRALPIHSVAARWGLVRAADFSRAFRAAYGMTPRDFRARSAQEAATDHQRHGVARAAE
ncbi:AraC family transcriptional regulator [Streptomyces aureoverticillatus]|nr:AraC family transcriptional regulator [Streptomyces aureoverticillatus]